MAGQDVSAEGRWEGVASRGRVFTLATATTGAQDRIISGGEDRTVRLWDPTTGEQTGQLRGHTLAVRAVVAAVVDGLDRIVSGGEDRTVRLWDPTTGQEIRRFTGHSGRITALAVAKVEGKERIAIASADRTARLWDPVTGAEVRQLRGHTGEVAALVAARLYDQDRIVTASYDGTVCVWDPTTAEEILRFTGHTGAVWAVAASTDRIISAGYDGTVRVWDPTTGDEIRQLTGHTGAVRGLAVVGSEGQENVVGGDESGVVHLWDPVTGMAHKVALHDGMGVASARPHPVRAIAVARLDDRDYIISAGHDGLVRLWDPTTGDEIRQLTGHTGRATAITLSTAGAQEWIGTAGDDSVVRLWDPTTGNEIHQLTGIARPLLRAVAAIVFGDQDYVVTAGVEGVVRIWDPATGQQVRQLTGHSGELWALTVANVGGQDRIISAGDDGTVRLWDPTTGQEVRRLTVHTFGALPQPPTAIRAVAAGRVDDDDRIVAGGQDGVVRLWVPTTDDASHLLTLHDGAIGVRSDYDIRELTGHTGTVRAITIARLHDHDRIITGGDDGTVRVWDPTTGLEVRQLTGHTGAVRAVTVARLHGQDRIITAGDDGTVRVWDSDTGLEVRDPLLPHAGAVLGVVALGDRVATIGDDGMLVVQPLAVPPPVRAHTAMVSDEATAHDKIGSFGLVARAVADFLLDPDTKPPVTIGVKGPWGGGKSSVMLMIRDLVDPETLDTGRRQIALVEREGHGAWRRLITRISRRPSQLSTGEAFEQSDHPAPDVARPEGLDPEAERVWRPSVWFNPWHHQTGEQVWAGLATCIVDEISGRMSRIDRERFFFRLNLARVDRQAARRAIYGVLWRRVAGPLAVLAALTVLAGAIWSTRWAAGGLSLAALAAMGASLVSVLRTPLGRVYPTLVQNPAHTPLSDALEDIASAGLFVDPRHAAKAGYSYLAYVDLKRVIDLVATPRRPLVIFIDDLDRCSPSVVAQTLEALNLFLAGPFKNCTFVMAIEPTILAAHIASANESLVKVLGADTSSGATGVDQQIGWRFLEKMVQLPVMVPRPTRDQASTYLTSLLPAIGDSADNRVAASEGHPHEGEEPPVTSEATFGTEVSLSLGGNVGLKGSIGPFRISRSSVGDPQRSVVSTEDGPHPHSSDPVEPDVDGMKSGNTRQAPAQERFARNLASDPAFHDACNWAAQNLVPSLNPRQLKRLLAMIELYALIANRLGYLALESPDTLVAQLREIGVLAALNVRWPHLVDRLLAPLPADPHGPLVVERLRTDPESSDAHDWPPAHRGSVTQFFHELPADLRLFLQQHGGALSMAARLTTLQPADETKEQ